MRQTTQFAPGAACSARCRRSAVLIGAENTQTRHKTTEFSIASRYWRARSCFIDRSMQFPGQMSMPSQYIALVRHFFGRFFDNEFIAQNADVQVTVTKTLALLASPGMLLPFFRYTTYLALDGYPPEARMATLWFDRCFLFSFAILVMGGVTVLEWDALFPDRRDYVSLIPLPIRARTIFLAKVGALVLFLLGFTAAVSAVSTVLFPIFLFASTSTHTFASVGLKTLAGLGGLGWTMAAQGISVLAASAFVFLSLIALEGLLLNILSTGGFRRASVYVQCAMIFALLSLFFLFPNIAASIPDLKARNALLLYAFPPAWFLGLNEVLLGSPIRCSERWRDGRRWRSRGAGAGRGRRLHAGVSKARAAGRSNRWKARKPFARACDGWLSALADRIAPHPLERATVAFIGKTMARSARHRIFLAAYTGVGCAFVLQALVGTGLRQAWLSIPLVLSFFMLSGMRYIFTLPSELPANWLFRVTESDDRRQALDGARTAMLWFGVAPLFAALAPFYFVLWPPGDSAGAFCIQRDDFRAAGGSAASGFLENSVYVFVSAGEGERDHPVDFLLAGVHNLRVFDGDAGSLDGAASGAADRVLRGGWRWCGSDSSGIGNDGIASASRWCSTMWRIRW